MERKRQKKVFKWDVHHEDYVAKWHQVLAAAKAHPKTLSHYRQYDQGAFDNYLAWFLSNSRVELCAPAFDSTILEDPPTDTNFRTLRYNKLVRDGTQTKFAPLLNFMVIRFSCTSRCHKYKLCVDISLYCYSARRSRSKPMRPRKQPLILGPRRATVPLESLRR